MRIGVVTTSFPREPGDPAGSFVASHVRWLEREGHEVEVIAAGDRAALPGRSAEARAHRLSSRLFYRGGAPEALESGGLLRLAAAAGFSLRQLAAIARRLHRWDAVCAHWLAPSAAAVAAARIARRDTTPFLAIAHSGDVHLLDRLRLVAPVARMLCAAGARVSFSSGALARRMIDGAGAELGDRLGERSLVCPMGVDVGVEVSAHAGPPRRSTTLLFLGRLVPIKGVDTLLEAVARLGDRFDLIVAGDGPERAALERRAAELGIARRTRFVGEVRSLFRDSLLAGADVLVAPSRTVGGRTEGMPVAVLEAIASGTPVVVCASGGLAELPESVPKVAPDDPAGLAAAIAPLGDPAIRLKALERQRPIAEAQGWGRVGATLWRHWIPASARARRTA